MTRRCTPVTVDPTRAVKLDHRTEYLPSQHVLCSQLRPFVLNALANDPSLLSRLDAYHVAALERFAVATSSHEQTQALLPLVGLGRHPNVSFLTKIGFNYHAEGADKALINTCPEVCTCPSHQGPSKLIDEAATAAGSSSPTSSSSASSIDSAAAAAAATIAVKPTPIYNCFNRFRDYVYQSIENRDLMDEFVADPCFIPRCHNKLSLIALIRICMRFEIDYSAYFQWAEYRGLNGPSSTTRFKRNRAAAARAAETNVTGVISIGSALSNNNNTSMTTAVATSTTSATRNTLSMPTATTAAAATAATTTNALVLSSDGATSAADLALQSSSVAANALAMHPSDFRIAAVLAAAAAVASAPHQPSSAAATASAFQQHHHQLLRNPFVQRIQETAAAITAAAQSALPASVQSTLPGVRSIAVPVQRSPHRPHSYMANHSSGAASAAATPSYTVFHTMVNPYGTTTSNAYSNAYTNTYSSAAPNGTSASSLGCMDDVTGGSESAKRLRIYAPTESSLPSRSAHVYAAPQQQHVQHVQSSLPQPMAQRYVSVPFVQVDAHPHDSYVHASPQQHYMQHQPQQQQYYHHQSTSSSSSSSSTSSSSSHLHHDLSSPVVTVGRSLIPSSSSSLSSSSSSHTTVRSAPVTVLSTNEPSLGRYVSFDSQIDVQPTSQLLQQQSQAQSQADSTVSSSVSTPASTQSGSLPPASVSHDSSPVSTSSNCTYVSTLAESPDHVASSHAAHAVHTHFHGEEVSPAPFLSSSTSTGSVVSSALPPSQWYTVSHAHGSSASSMSSMSSSSMSALKAESVSSSVAPSSSMFPSSSFLHLGSAVHGSHDMVANPSAFSSYVHSA